MIGDGGTLFGLKLISLRAQAPNTVRISRDVHTCGCAMRLTFKLGDWDAHTYKDKNF
jgi:hypothetical protein